MSKCINPKLGNLIHAYELKTLKDEDAEQFELHLLSCDHCFNELSSFHDEVSMLLSDDQIKQAVEENLTTKASGASAKRPAWRSLWPERMPIVLKPAVGYVLTALVIVVWLGSSILNPPEKIRGVQAIGFYQTRSSESHVFYKDKSGDAVIKFIVPAYDGQQQVEITVFGSRNEWIYANSHFGEIEGSGMGRLYLSLDDLNRGEYALELKIAENNPPLDRIVYSFEIK